MHILNDFFLLNWDEKSDSIEFLSNKLSQTIFDTLDIDFEHFCDSCSILFIANSENFEKLIDITEFRLIFNAIFKDMLIDKSLILQTQKSVLAYILDLGNPELNTVLKHKFEILRKERVITYYMSRRLIALFGLIKSKNRKKLDLKLKKASSGSNFYKNSKNVLLTAIENLKICVEVDDLLHKLELVKEKLNSEKFSIGITGIINAGKSTMLNSLLKEEILGTSVVPETANLTILKYAKQRFAKVNFWDKAEFSKIEKSARENKNIQNFIDETRAAFKTTIGEYIKEKGRVDTIKIEDLAYFTSAEASNKKCNLVKSVELYSDLEFLKDGVEIVDTPGLDDPIVQREEITLKYISECDLMIHLMNVNQSATKKDVDFIIDAIIYQNIARLLIVITKIDTVSKEELDEVIEYTKRSISARLKEQNRSHKVKSIIEKLDFIPISGKAALSLRINKEHEAKKIGYDIQSSGILRVEEYLNSVLFGDMSEKANLIIQSNLSDLLSILTEQKNIFGKERLLLGKSAAEIKKEYQSYKEKRENIISILRETKQSIKREEDELRNYFKTLYKFSSDRLIELRDLIKVRVMDDVTYEMRKNKTYPKAQRIEYIVENGIKDGLVDLIRDYRYEFQKKMQESFEIIKRNFDKNEENEDYKNDNFDAREFLEKQLKTFIIFQNREILLTKVNENIKKYAKHSLGKLDTILSDLLQDTIKELQKSLDLKLEKINQDLLENFINISKKRVEKQELEIEMQDNLMKKMMENIKGAALNKEQRVEEIKDKLEAIKLIEQELNQLSMGKA